MQYNFAKHNHSLGLIQLNLELILENKPDDAREVRYKMEEMPRGYCLIIGNNNFQNSEPRKGTEQDIEKLGATFKWLNFKVEIEKDCKAEDIRRLMEEYSTIDHGKFDCFICCILSHGDSQGISGTDNKNVTLNEIQEGLQKCKTLVGKPKVFFYPGMLRW